MRRAEYDSHLSLRAMQDVPVSYQDELDLSELDEELGSGGEHRGQTHMGVIGDSKDSAPRPCLPPQCQCILSTHEVGRLQCEAYGFRTGL